LVSPFFFQIISGVGKHGFFQDKYLRITTYSPQLLYTYLKWDVTLQSPKVYWRRIYKFITCRETGSESSLLQEKCEYGN
jgi:hypothetical protein